MSIKWKSTEYVCGYSVYPTNHVYENVLFANCDSSEMELSFIMERYRTIHNCGKR